VPDVRKAHEHLLEQGAAPVGVREVVADSWLRSVAAGVDVNAIRPPITLSSQVLGEYRAEHPLAGIVPLLDDVLGRAAEDCGSVMAVADARGQLLWVRGRPEVLRRAESICFVEGAQWDERHAGTNAPGTALRLDAPVTIKSAEHFVRPVQRWSCAAAPVHEPGSGAILGVIDITGGREVDAPQTIAMVRAAARMAESELARHALIAASRYPEPLRAAAGPLAAVSLSALGRPECVVSTGTRTVRLSPRHSEIMVILAACPAGLTGDDLHRCLRAAILAAGQPEYLVSWTRTRWGADDLEVWQRLCAVLPGRSPLRPIAATAAKLDAEFGC
jgi:hypothetical protein